jgi:hypothetical protein
MKKLLQGGSLVLLGFVFAVALTALQGTPQTAFGRAEGETKSGGGARYTVIETQGFNLLAPNGFWGLDR